MTEKPINPHTGRPLPEESDAAAAPAPAPGASDDARRSSAEAPGPAPARPGPPAAPAGMPASDPAYETAARAPSFKAATEAATAAPSQQELAIRSALETVMDPEINLSVIDLGLIREILIRPEGIHIKMMLTTPFCPYAPQMVEDVKRATMSVVPVECEVELLPDPWSPDLMPDPGLLGYSF